MNEYNVYGRNRYCKEKKGNWYKSCTLLIKAQNKTEAEIKAMEQWREIYQMADDIETIEIEQLNKPAKGEQLELI